MYTKVKDSNQLIAACLESSTANHRSTIGLDDDGHHYWAMSVRGLSTSVSEIPQNLMLV